MSPAIARLRLPVSWLLSTNSAKARMLPRSGFVQRLTNARSCRIGDMTVPEGGFATEWTPTEPSKRQFAEGRGRLCARCLLCLLADVLAAILLCLLSSSRCFFAPFATTAIGAFFMFYFFGFMYLFSISESSTFLKGLQMLAVNPCSVGFFMTGSSA